MLQAPNAYIEPFKVNFPDTVFYINGVCIDLVKNDSETGQIISIKADSKLNYESIRNSFARIVRERRKYISR
jgi:hypothetical protein